ncbi:hypothetical protein C1Y63_04865 [Corynebacterium sp. 13CS0277]|uniref:hypothetical protein n=1 Tax=Corynebacterium sp. 13CS0277 TaxID=2071994 RepID=UPI000D037B6E|nr:hypothetical protein [Corynebacterium sp. 13CS0277]PRQ11743.1 hypothetical protein C1Y63_04865 [Corynebacterium sp. 13CS0277]
MRIQQQGSSLVTQLHVWTAAAVDVMGGYGPDLEPQVSLEISPSNGRSFEITMSGDEVAALHYMLGETMRCYDIDPWEED